MSEKNKGGPAFPGPDQQEQRENIHEGMMLRDYFAAKAPITLEAAFAFWNRDYITNSSEEGIRVYMEREESRRGIFDSWADLRYEYADAMLRARDTYGEQDEHEDAEHAQSLRR